MHFSGDPPKALGNCGLDADLHYRSPFTTVQAFDSFVQYEQPLPTRFDADGHPLPSQPNRKRDRESAEDNPDESRALRRRRNIPELPTG